MNEILLTRIVLTILTGLFLWYVWTQPVSFIHFFKQKFPVDSKNYSENRPIPVSQSAQGDNNKQSSTTGPNSPIINFSQTEYPLPQVSESISPKAIKIKIARISEDAEEWLPKQKESFLVESNRITNDAARRNVPNSGGHISRHIENVNNFIETIDAYLKKITRDIQDQLLVINVDSFETAEGFQDEYHKFLQFKASTETAIDWTKKQNYSICSRFTDKTTLDNILQGHIYAR